MKLLFSVFLLFAMFLPGCSSDKKHANVESNRATTEIREIPKTQDVKLTAIDGYFSTNKPKQTENFLIKGQSEFDKNFQMAKTMTNSPTKIDFTNNMVGAIVLPASEYDTKIVIDKSYVEGKVLHIYYTVDKGGEKRSFTAHPQYVFTFDSSYNVDAISFHEN